MGDPVIPERSGAHDATPRARAGIPAIPLIAPSEQLWDYPFPLLDEFSPTIGWRFRPADRGGPVFVIMRRSALGSLKVVESFPLTESRMGPGLEVSGQAESCRCPTCCDHTGSPADRRGRKAAFSGA